jgi:adenylate cyclase
MTVTRRLAAILAADVVGYTRLMGEDEAGTMNALRARRTELVEPLVKKHGGRVFKLMGDGLFAEFGSAVGATEFAVELQQAMATANRERPEAKGITLRIGINLGDVLVEGGDLYGDGVNLAARLQELAEPGGVCVSAKVHGEVARHLSLAFEDLGERRLKNIVDPVRAYRLDLAAPAARPAGGALPLPVKPSIVVLPFVNMSGEAEQEFFADGLTEDVITELSRFKELFVISRNSSFKYKGKPVNVAEVARALGVQYVIEGSVRKAANRVRVTVQLIDAETDRHLWAERYDRQLEDIFAIQDEVTSAVASTLAGRVEAATRERAANKPTENMAAYECLLAGKVLHHRATRADNERAAALLERAIALDPKLAQAHAWKACLLGQAWGYNWARDRAATWAEIGREAQIALGLDENDSDVHRILAALAITADDHDKALYHQQRALALNPNDDLVVVQQGEILTWMGQPEEGIDWIQRAMRLNPYHPERFWSHLGRAYFVARRPGEAIDSFRKISAPDHLHHSFLAAAHAMKGNADAARDHAAQVMKLSPGFTIGQFMATTHYRNAADRDRHRDALLAAGLPA